MKGSALACHFRGKYFYTFGVALLDSEAPRCWTPACSKPAHANRLCIGCDAQWRRLLASPKPRGVEARRKYQCQVAGCTEWHLPRDFSKGRTLDSRWFCREHEHLHLAAPENLELLGAGLRRQDECWIYRQDGWQVQQYREPLLDYNEDGYAKFQPYGTGNRRKDGTKSNDHWYAHRSLWLMLMGSIGINRQLDHLDDCTVKTSCCNPAHLETTTPAVNKKRQAARRRVEAGHQRRTVRECGPRVNKEAALNPKVIQFAQDHDLPLPVID